MDNSLDMVPVPDKVQLLDKDKHSLVNLTLLRLNHLVNLPQKVLRQILRQILRQTHNHGGVRRGGVRGGVRDGARGGARRDGDHHDGVRDDARHDDVRRGVRRIFHLTYFSSPLQKIFPFTVCGIGVQGMGGLLC